MFPFHLSAESASLDAVKNAVQVLVKTGVIESVHEGNVKRLSITPLSVNDSRLEEILERLEATRICNMI